MPKEALAPVDDSVTLPPSVLRAAAAADALHKQVYTPDNPAPQPDPQAAPQPEPQPQPDPPQPEPQPQPDPQAAPQPEPQPEPSAPIDWEHRYHSMEGRYKQASTTIGSLQQQMQELGDELARTQALITRPNARPQPAPQPQKLITDADRETYGQELIDTIQRAAREAVAPDLQNVSQQVQQASQQVTQQQQQGVYAALNADVPNWREVNNNPRFKQWCSLPDLYSGQLRGKLLNAAFRAANAPRVIAFFKGFIADEVATGQVSDPQPQPGASQPAPRQAAVALDTLTAPGRPKPAPGASSAGAADKPVFTRAQISKFYADSREAGLGKGPYAGREADRKADEAAIFAAQKEGRVRG